METKVSRQIIQSLTDDVVKSAEAVNLIYVSDSDPGITRVRDGDGFKYYYKNEQIKETEQLIRIKSLVIPPAWENVWICPLSNGHLQATGYDTRNRKQYRYHPLWISLRGETKYYRLHSFGESLPAIRKKVNEDLNKRGLHREKVLAAVISLMEQTNIRIGNTLYEKLYGSFGLSTLKDQNVKIKGSSIRFVFKGKKSVNHDISIRNRKLARIVQRCREIPGKDLFQYYDENGEAQTISSGDVNEYIRQISGQNFTSKDFRTWAGSVECIRAFRHIGFNRESSKKDTVAALDLVAASLGNTRSVCKKYYVHPLIIENYEKGELEDLIKKNGRDSKWMTAEEKVLMKILESQMADK